MEEDRWHVQCLRFHLPRIYIYIVHVIYIFIYIYIYISSCCTGFAATNPTRMTIYHRNVASSSTVSSRDETDETDPQPGRRGRVTDSIVPMARQAGRPRCFSHTIPFHATRRPRRRRRVHRSRSVARATHERSREQRRDKTTQPRGASHVPPLALIVEAVDAVDRRALVVAAQDEEVLRVPGMDSY